jgi:hypothetical protein
MILKPDILIDNEYITVRYLPDKRTIYHTIHKPFSGQLFRDALLAGTKSLIENGACKWLSDDRLNGPLSEEDTVWALQVWHAQAIAAGWKFWAVVVPPEVVAAGSLVPIIDSLFERGLRMMAFADLGQAQAWLDQMQEPKQQSAAR